MKKLVISSIALLLSLQNSYAAHSELYVGIGASENSWRVTQDLAFDPTKVATPSLYDRGWGTKKGLIGGEVMAGIKASNGSLYAAFEAWYNPNSFEVNNTSDDINFTTNISNRWGGRVLAGVQHKEMTVYGIVGLGKMKVASASTFPSTGLYGTLPGVSLTSTDFSATETTSALGIGMSVAFTNGWNLSAEYQHHQTLSEINTRDNLITFLGIIGTQATHVTSDSVHIAMKYQFKSIVF
jgi:opacity protein-like surface antigen